jgi:hypothetical protein
MLRLGEESVSLGLYNSLERRAVFRLREFVNSLVVARVI